MSYATINPYNNQLIKEFQNHPFPDLSLSQKAYDSWRKLTVEQRGKELQKVAAVLEKNKRRYAELITLEMGKPLREGEYEIAKVLTTFEYYIKNAPAFLKDEIVPTQASKSYIKFEPMGIIFSVMPWNFPFWQVFRFAIPTLISGNVSVLKHASNVPQCAAAIEDAFREAGVTDNIFRNYFLSNEDSARVIADPLVMGVSFTGSDGTGSVLAGLAGKHLKKCVMELGGNDAFIVLDDADIDFTVTGAIKSRSINSGQSCNAAKRFIVTEKASAAFTTALVKAVQQLQPGNPVDDATQVGPLAKKDLVEKASQQIAASISAGAIAYYGMETPATGGNFMRPTVLTGVRPGTPAFDEEIFAPVWSVITVKNEQEAVAAANNSVYGLGASVWTKDQVKAEKMIPELNAGNVFINEIVKSDPRLPFGGIKRSGFGRELSEHGLLEFVNIKTVFIH